MDPQAQEALHSSSTDSYLTFPHSSDSPRPFPPSPAHYVSASPEGVAHLPIVTNNPPIDNVVTHSVTVHAPPIPIPSTIPIFGSSQTHPSILLSPTPFSILLISLDRFLKQVPQCSLEFLPSLPILDLHFLTLSLCLLHPCLPWSLPALYLPLPLLVGFSQILDLVLPGGQLRFPGLPLLGKGELPGAEEEAGSPPLPVVRLLPSPATFGRIFNPAGSPLEVPPLRVP